jgi:hypothetical protein
MKSSLSLRTTSGWSKFGLERCKFRFKLESDANIKNHELANKVAFGKYKKYYIGIIILLKLGLFIKKVL